MASQFRYEFRDKPLTIKNAKDADAQQIGEAFEAIAIKYGPRLKAGPALIEARKPRHPLHKHIEWRDAVAAEKHRLAQMNELIGCIVRFDPAKTESKPQRAWLSIHDAEGTSYRNVDEVLNSVDLQMRVMQQAHRDLSAWRNRYAELADICDLVRVAENRLQSEIARREARPTPRRRSRSEPAHVSA